VTTHGETARGEQQLADVSREVFFNAEGAKRITQRIAARLCPAKPQPKTKLKQTAEMSRNESQTLQSALWGREESTPGRLTACSKEVGTGRKHLPQGRGMIVRGMSSFAFIPLTHIPLPYCIDLRQCFQPELPTNLSVLQHENFIAACEQFRLAQCRGGGNNSSLRPSRLCG
jgi:hypothetical protein